MASHYFFSCICSVILFFFFFNVYYMELICCVGGYDSHLANQTSSFAKSQFPLAIAGWLKAAPQSAPVAPEQPGNQGSWVTIEQSIVLSWNPRFTTHVFTLYNRFSQLSYVPAEKLTVEIGSSILQNVTISTSAAIVKCIPGARAGDMETNLKLQAKSKCKIR